MCAWSVEWDCACAFQSVHVKCRKLLVNLLRLFSHVMCSVLQSKKFLFCLTIGIVSVCACVSVNICQHADIAIKKEHICTGNGVISFLCAVQNKRL